MRFKCEILIFLVVTLNAEASWYGVRDNDTISFESIKELEKLGEEIRFMANYAVNKSHYPCYGYYDYVCADNFFIVSVLGSMPRINDIVLMQTALENDLKDFEAKQKLLAFFSSCSKDKSVDDCYVETFEYFRPVFGYIISRKFINHEDLETLRDVMSLFIQKANTVAPNHPLISSLTSLQSNLAHPRNFFHSSKLDQIYQNLTIHPSYKHNVKNLEVYNKLYGNRSDFANHYKSVLDFTIYLYQSRNKPRGYYYPTLNVHLWMSLLNSTVRYSEEYQSLANCLRLPTFLNDLREARLLAVIYFRAFKYAFEEYTDWFLTGSGPVRHAARAQDIFDKEDDILRKYELDNKRLFFVLYAQNFCSFGKIVAENVFYHGLKHNIDFINLHQCNIGEAMNPVVKCDV